MSRYADIAGLLDPVNYATIGQNFFTEFLLPLLAAEEKTTDTIFF